MEGESVKIKIEKFGRNQKVEDRVGLRRVYIQSDPGLHDCQRRGRDKGGDCHDQIRTDVV